MCNPVPLSATYLNYMCNFFVMQGFFSFFLDFCVGWVDFCVAAAGGGVFFRCRMT